MLLLVMVVNNIGACASIPICRQFVINCRTGKGDEALSFWFLMLWVFGDSTNLIGAIFSKQLGTEVKLNTLI